MVQQGMMVQEDIQGGHTHSKNKVVQDQTGDVPGPTPMESTFYLLYVVFWLPRRDRI